MSRLFAPGPGPRVFALPPGCDYAAELVAGLRARLDGQPPEAMARVEVIVNTARLARRLTALLAAGPAALLPRIRVLDELAEDPALDLPAPVAALRRRLELAQAVARLIAAAPDLAGRAATYDLADSLAGLLDEMQGEGVPLAALAALDVSRHSQHWERSLRFLALIADYLGPGAAPDQAGRLRLAAEGLAARWAAAPPAHPVIVAGSTGSRGATALLMAAVARLPQGAVVLPGYDTDLPEAVWAGLDDALHAEDHPQYRFRRLMDRTGLAPAGIAPWTGAAPACPPRNRLISLALRPAPVTDQWLDEGPRLTDLAGATAGMTLIEAPSPRIEALAIALRLRQAAEAGQTAALITPDRVLTRQVTAALDRWGILPDDSAGTPLPLTPPGRLLRQVAALFGERLTGEALLALLKHPLVHSGTERGEHLRRSRDLELELLRGGPPFPSLAEIAAWAAARETDPGAAGWARWLADCLGALGEIGPRPLAGHLATQREVSERLSAGPVPGPGTLWDREAGAKAAEVMAALHDAADAGGTLSPAEYQALFRSVLDRAEVRSPTGTHPGVMILGTLEARVQAADLVILAGLNEGVWPQMPAPDPWLNRQMRADAGLLLPERRIGLSAHDFQQGIAAREVVVSRAVRDGEAPTVPSRWLNRLGNLLAGLGEPGAAALAGMRARGADWLALAAAVETPPAPLPAARRPAPRPPLAARPKRLSVTQIRTLIRDPYTIYARHVLRLRPLDPLRPQPDALLRGTVLHRVLDRFVRETAAGLPPDAAARLGATAAEVLARDVPWPATRALWLARITRLAGWFAATEAERRQTAEPAAFEVRGRLGLDGIDFTLTGTADRIDRTLDGQAVIYDYKTGAIPTGPQIRLFDKQLPLEATMLERGAFAGLPALPVAGLVYIGLGPTPRVAQVLREGLVAETWAGLHELMRAWADPARGYIARARLERRGDTGDYDHLSRLGEWDEGDPSVPEDVG